ncbi:arylsulfatase [bacterium]|nr:arylsulfatase [bacterium]
MGKRPNIILICTDQWRGDCLSCEDHPVVQTPYLDQIAGDGVRFNRAYSATPSCIPARAALFTGQKQETHQRVGYRDGVDWNYPTTIASEFTRHGYQTQAIGKMHVHPARSQVGFQNVILHDGYMHFNRAKFRQWDLVDDYLPWLREQTGRNADYFEHGLNCNSYVARPWDKPEYMHPTNWVTSQSIDFLRRRDTRKPFFMYVSYHRPHPPLDPPRWAFEQYRNQEMPPPPVGDWTHLFDEFEDGWRASTMVSDMDPQRLQLARAGYYGHLTHIDHQINRLIEAVSEYELTDETYVCFTSDHGDLLGDHHLFRKVMPYEGAARVPLIFSGPAFRKTRPRTVLDAPVALRDIMPTLLDCAGLPIPESVEGRSLLPLISGTQKNWREYLHGEHTLGGYSMQYLTDGRQKYIWHSRTGVEQLFDLTSDPTELFDLAAKVENADAVAGWRQRMITELSGREEGFSDGKQLISGKPSSPCLSELREETGTRF